MAIEEGCDAVVDLDAPLATSVGRPIVNKKAKAALVMAASMETYTKFSKILELN
jgi:hypothetical protein